jgi:hypothetical protein
MPDLPVACTLELSDLNARRSGLLQTLSGRADERRERDDGVVYTFTPAPDLLALIAEVVDAERRCCRFLRFELTVEPGEGPVHLRLSGPPGTREFLRDLLPAEEPC